MTEQEINERNGKLFDKIKHHADILGAHFATVQIFCTFHDASREQTSTFDVGRGSWYARYGQVREWSNYHDQMCRAKANDDHFKNKGDDDAGDGHA